MKETKQASLLSYSFGYLFKSVTILFSVMMCIILFSGIWNEFLHKREEARNYAQSLAKFAGKTFVPGIDIELAEAVARDIKDVKDENDIFKIDFVLLKDEFKAAKPPPSIIASLFKNKYKIFEMITFSDIKQEFYSQLPIQTEGYSYKEGTVLGYVNIEMDVHKIRMNWIQQHLWLISLMLSFYVITLFFIYKFSVWSARQAQELQYVANELLDSDNKGFIVLPLSNRDINFSEYIDIQHAFVSIVDRFNETQQMNKDLLIELEEFKEYGLSIYSRQSELQGLIMNELNGSLTRILGGVNSLGQQYLLEEQQDALSIVRKGAQQMKFVLDQIIRFQQIEDGHVSINRVEFSPLQLISDILMEFQSISNNKNIELLSKITHMEHQLEGDVEKIKNIVKTLLSNAVNYTDKGTVTLESNLQHFDHSTRWTIKIKDTGIGIADKYLDDIFTPFFQINTNSDNQGIGIGLATAKQLAELMDAKLTVSSELGQGTTFELVIPLFNKAQLIERKYLQGISLACFQKNENKQLIRDFYDFGAKAVYCSHNVDEVLDSLLRKSPDVLVISSDIKYRTVMKLVHAFREAENNHRCLIVWLVSSDMQFSREQVQAVGIDMIVPVPFDKKEFVIAIKDCLR